MVSCTAVLVVRAMPIACSANSLVEVIFNLSYMFRRYSIADVVSSGVRSENRFVCFHMMFRHSANARSTVWSV